MIKDIIKNENLICSEKEFKEYMDQQVCPDVLNFTINIKTFEDKFEGHTVTIPDEANSSDCWYSLIETTFGYRYLQTLDYKTGEVMDLDTAQTVSSNHAEDLKLDHAESWKIGKTIEHFKSVAESYIGKRFREYKSVHEQLGDLWNAINKGEALKDSQWFKEIEDVKTKYPKPDDEENNL